MFDDFSNLSRAAVVIILCFALIAVGFGAFNSLQSGREDLKESIQVIKGEEIVAEEIKADMTHEEYVENLVKDSNGEVVGVVIDGDNVGTVISTDEYNNYSIVNEAERHSYIFPICLIAVLVFIAVMYNMKQKAKRDNDKMNLEILNTKFKTYEQEEIEQLKEKYK